MQPFFCILIGLYFLWHGLGIYMRVVILHSAFIRVFQVLVTISDMKCILDHDMLINCLVDNQAI